MNHRTTFSHINAYLIGINMARKGGKRGRKGARRMKRHPISRGMSGVPEKASMTEIINNRAVSGGFYAVGTSYRLTNLSLALCTRATQVAQGYQEYRIRRISLAFKPLLDTFSAGTTNVALPYLYYMVDKRLAVPFNFTVDTLTSMGAKPRRFDDKTIVARYAPAVLQSSITDPASLTTALAAATVSPWLPVSSAPSQIGPFVPSDVDHTGIVWQVYNVAGPSVMYYDIDIAVDFEFRKPRINIPGGGPPPGARWAQWNEYAPPIEAPSVSV